MPPAKVNLRALDSRLRTTFSHMSRSTCTGSSSGGQSTTKSSPARSTAERKTLASSAVAAAQVDRLEPGVDPAGLEPGEVEQGVDQLAQPQGVALDDLELFADPRIGVEPGRWPAARRSAP